MSPVDGSSYFQENPVGSDVSSPTVVGRDGRLTFLQCCHESDLSRELMGDYVHNQMSQFYCERNAHPFSNTGLDLQQNRIPSISTPKSTSSTACVPPILTPRCYRPIQDPPGHHQVDEERTPADLVPLYESFSMANLKRLERDTWGAYGMESVLDPTELFNECKRRVKAAQRSQNLADIDREIARLEALDKLHRLRRAESSQSLYGNTTEPCKIWGVIIGIDDYYDHEPLYGCVQDARSVEEYLKTHLDVPDHRLTVLLNKDATRDNIWRALWSAVDHCTIGDHVILYFAGRGTAYKVPSQGFDTTHATQVNAICPADRRCTGEAQPILDITCDEVLRLLSDLRYVHSARITAILDCSFYGGGNAKPLDPPLYSSIMGRYALPLDIPHYDGPRSAVSVIKAMGILDWTSTLVLTACTPEQVAHESFYTTSNGYRGCFTKALLSVLETEGCPSFPFDDILYRVGVFLKDSSVIQTPVIIGARQDEGFWI